MPVFSSGQLWATPDAPSVTPVVLLNIPQATTKTFANVV